jgi:glycosyltransferase involved in cell wall biosynthesis
MNPPKPLKILMLVSSYPRTEEDSASIFLRYLAENLHELGLNIHVLAPSDRNATTTHENGIVVHRFRYFPAAWQKLAYGSGMVSNLRQMPWLWLQVPFFLVAMAYSLLRVIRKEQPDLIHAHWILPQGLIALLAKYLYKLPVITTAHGADTFAFQWKLANGLKRFVVSKSNAWTSNTHSTSEAIGSIASLRTPHVIPMGVNVRLFSAGNSTSLRRELPENEILVLFVGRLVEKKGCHDLLQAYALISHDLRARTTLWIVGDGDESIRLQEYAARIGAGTRVRFWGSLSNDRLPNFYAAADLVIVPSVEASSGDTEGQGIVLLEAFAASACILATRVGGIGEVVQDGVTGVLVEPHNPKQLANAMEELLRGGSLRAKLAKNAFAKVKEYDWEKVAERFEELYQQILKSNDDRSLASRRL